MHIMGHQPNVLPSVALGVIVLAMHRIEGVERFAELAIGCLSAHKLCVLVEVVIFIRLAALIKIVVIFGPSQLLSKLSDARICQSVLQSLSNGFVFGV